MTCELSLPDQPSIASPKTPRTDGGSPGCEEILVNSLHGQGLLVEGRRIVVEGWAEDGTPEALCIANAPGFALGVQWHAEYAAGSDPVNRRLFEAFGAAVG